MTPSPTASFRVARRCQLLRRCQTLPDSPTSTSTILLCLPGRYPREGGRDKRGTDGAWAAAGVDVVHGQKGGHV
jgi:hypothetical protein